MTHAPAAEPPTAASNDANDANDPPNPTSRAGRVASAFLHFLLGQWVLLTMGLFILLAYFFPHVGTTGGSIRAEYTVAWGAVGLIFLIAGLSLDIATLLAGLPHWRAHAVANVFSFLVAPAIMFGFATAGRKAGLDTYVLAGMVVTGCMPTTIASNVTCTMNAGGSTELASIEVILGNVLGTFITPLLARMFMDSPQWATIAPGSGTGVTPIYIRMAKQLSATLIAPLIVGLALQYCFPGPVSRIRRVLRLAKVASLMVILCVWENFCKAFASGAFKTTSHATIIYLCFICLTLYFVFSVIIFVIMRLPGIHTRAADYWRFSKRDAIALCFCGPAKGVAVGAPLIAILYHSATLEVQAKLALAIIIYNGEQVACAQLVVPLLRRWARSEVEEGKETNDDETIAGSPEEPGVVQDQEKCLGNK